MERIEKIIPKKPELPISQEKEKSLQEKKENLLLKNLLDDFRMLFQDEKIITSDLDSLKEKIKEKQIISDAHIFDVLKNLGMILGNRKKLKKEIIFQSKNALRDYLFLLNQDEEFLKGELENKLGAHQEFGKMSLFSYIEISKNLFELKELNQDIREETEDLIKRGIITGGMLPKVKACIEALKGGIRKTHIIDGRVPHSLLLEIFTDKGIGTEIIRS